MHGTESGAPGCPQITRLACTECGKVCRSDAEKEMHTRFTGHSQFEDKTNEAHTLDSEKEMKVAKAEMMEVDGAGPSTSSQVRAYL